MRHCSLSAHALSACTVGPDFVPPKPDTPPGWSQTTAEGLDTTPQTPAPWWHAFADPVLDELVATALENNNTLELTGLNVLKARAQLGIATGSQYPQTQVLAGDATYLAPADNALQTDGFWSYGAGATASWEIDFWGRFRRGIEAADASYLASIAAYDQARVLLIGAVVTSYITVRSLEEQVRIAHENVSIQQRSYDIALVLFNNGADSELDVQQSLTLLLSTQASIPGLEISLAQSRNALSVLLGQSPGAVKEVLAKHSGIPIPPDNLSIGLPADMLRQRPDVRQAELQARAANALVGVAEANLYPSFSLTGSIGISAGGPGDSDFGDLFSSDALAWSVGPSFVWPFLNYGRLRNNVRVQDATLQQALVNYRETVLQAAREAEDAMAQFIGSKQQQAILRQTVVSAKRSNELSTLRYREGYSDYERVLNAQQALFAQETRYVSSQGDTARAMASLFTALGGGWQFGDPRQFISAGTRNEMQERTNWGGLIEAAQDRDPDQQAAPASTADQ